MRARGTVSFAPFAFSSVVHLLRTFSATPDSRILPLRESLDLYDSHHKRYGFSASMTLSLYCIAFMLAWGCLSFSHLCSTSLLLCFPLSELLAWVEVSLGFSLPLSALTLFAEPFFLSSFFSFFIKLWRVQK